MQREKKRHTGEKVGGMPTSKNMLGREPEGGPRGSAERNLGEAGSCHVSDTTKKLCMIT